MTKLIKPPWVALGLTEDVWDLSMLFIGWLWECWWSYYEHAYVVGLWLQYCSHKCLEIINEQRQQYGNICIMFNPWNHQANLILKIAQNASLMVHSNGWTFLAPWYSLQSTK